jgi:hypothetical protein
MKLLPGGCLVSAAWTLITPCQTPNNRLSWSSADKHEAPSKMGESNIITANMGNFGLSHLGVSMSVTFIMLSQPGKKTTRKQKPGIVACMRQQASSLFSLC